MARRRYQARRRFYPRARTWARSGFRRARAWGSRQGFGGIRPSISAPFIGGLALGLTDVSGKIPMVAKIGVACVPLRGDGVGTAKALAQGVLLGDAVRFLTGFKIPVLGMLGMSNGTVAATGTRTFGSE